MAKNILGLIEMKANKELILEETFKLAYQKHKKNNFREAEKLYKTILKVHPDIIRKKYNEKKIIVLIKEIDGFEEKTAIKFAKGLPKFISSTGHIYHL